MQYCTRVHAYIHAYCMCNMDIQYVCTCILRAWFLWYSRLYAMIEGTIVSICIFSKRPVFSHIRICITCVCAHVYTSTSMFTYACIIGCLCPDVRTVRTFPCCPSDGAGNRGSDQGWSFFLEEEVSFAGIEEWHTLLGKKTEQGTYLHTLPVMPALILYVHTVRLPSTYVCTIVLGWLID